MLGTAVLLAACGGSGTTPPPTAGGPPATSGTGATGGITATESDFKIEVSAATAAAGPVTFHVTNSGAQTHEFVVIKTDTAADALPTDDSGAEVDEDASGLTVVDEVEDLAPGTSADLDVTLDAGKYVLICNVPGHYQLGMHTEFTVGS
ncbi:MAG TPA: sulfocyanin-like copper-binding protein [Candidatus Limnocylindrales bacterium]|nr:sulfocyanin-like copper-binding protein [Candidatus Limnocylindrales bacterium]